MIKTYCNYEVFNTNTGCSLEAGDMCNEFSYLDKGKKITLNDIYILDISINDITIQLDDSKDVIIDIDNIVDWY